MCTEPLYALRLKTEFDERFKRFKKRTPLQFIGSVRKFSDGTYATKEPIYDKLHYDLLIISCGQCWHCRLIKSRTKAFQCVCESQQYDKNCFVTLTFGYDELFNYFRKEKKMSYYMSRKLAHFHCWSLENELVTNFIKRLRNFYYNRELGLYLLSLSSDYQKYVYDDQGNFRSHIRCPKELKKDFKPKYKIRYYHCGEYGSKKGRPHHHICFFGIDFSEFGSLTEWFSNGKIYHQSDVLSKLWKFGISTVDSFNYHTGAYVARYCTKKVYGCGSELYYDGRKPEYSTSSNRRGLGYDYAVKNWKELLNRNGIIIMTDKKKLEGKIPKYFLDIIKLLHPEEYYAWLEKNIEKNNIDLEKLLKSKRSIYTDLDSKNKKSICILNSLCRDMEAQDIPMSEFVNKCGAHGISNELIYKLGLGLKERLNLTWKDYKRKSSNYIMQAKYKEFENDRKKAINKVYSWKNISKTDEEINSEIEFIKAIKNPYKVNKRGYQMISNAQKDNISDFEYLERSNINER